MASSKDVSLLALPLPVILSDPYMTGTIDGLKRTVGELSVARPIMIDDLYNARILEFAGNISRLGRLDDPDGTAKAHSKLCGSTVIVDLKLKDGVVAEFAHEVRACALGQASSAIMARNIVGASPQELRDVHRAMQAMLKAGGAPPEGRFADLKFLEPVRDHRARHASTLLTFEAVEAALDMAEAGRAGAAA